MTERDRDELDNVRASGQLWGKAKRQCMGNAAPRVKAFKGPLPESERGYTFETPAVPSRDENFHGTPGVSWIEGDPGVFDVPGLPGYVGIEVRIVDAED